MRRRGRTLIRPEGFRVLLVDDDPTVLYGYRRMLERHGVTVDTASNGKEAVERVKNARFDVIVSDISMPEMTGLEFLRAVRAHDLDVPVILATGEPSLDSAMQAIEYGAFRYLPKPVSPEHLWGIVSYAAKLHKKLARLKRLAHRDCRGREGPRLGERAALEVRFSWGLAGLWMAFQPIVSWRQKLVFGCEALLRSDEPLMKSPADMPRRGRAARSPPRARTSRSRERREGGARGSRRRKALRQPPLRRSQRRGAVFAGRAPFENRLACRPRGDGASVALRRHERRGVRG